jgi:peroxiredoxin
VAVAVGDEAPDFTLRDQHNQEVTLSSFRGRQAVVLVFYPLTFTAICGGEMCALREDLAAFQNEGAQLLAVSVDSVHAHRVWAEQEGFAFPLLADFWPHGQVARDYGVFDDALGFALRGTFVIDRDGVVRWKVVHGVRDARDLEDYRGALAAL